jgi:hypothetical protein
MWNEMFKASYVILYFSDFQVTILEIMDIQISTFVFDDIVPYPWRSGVIQENAKSSSH